MGKFVSKDAQDVQFNLNSCNFAGLSRNWTCLGTSRSKTLRRKQRVHSGKRHFYMRSPDQIQTKVIELLFRVMDANGDGFISKVEMLESSPNLTMSQVDAVFRRNDGDSDGKLSKDEFKDMIKRNSRERKITRFHSTESVKSLSMAPLKEERSRSSGGSCSRSIKTSESVKSLSRTPLQERSRSTGGSVRIKTSRSRSAGKSMERRHSESRIQNVPGEIISPNL